EAFTKCSPKARGFLGRPTVDEANHRHRRLLRPRRERPRGRRAEKRDELAAFHCPVPPVLPTAKYHTWARQETAALRAFNPPYDRPVRAGCGSMGAAPQRLDFKS